MNTLATQFQALLAEYRTRGVNNGEGMLPPLRIWEHESYEGLSKRSIPGIEALVDAALKAARTMDKPHIEFFSEESR